MNAQSPVMNTLSRYLLTALLFGILFLVPACKGNNPAPEDNPTIDYKYLNAAEIRESVTEAQRAEYASYAWRIERNEGSAFPKNFRTCMDEFKEQERHNGFDPDYIPSRQGLDDLKVSASSDFSDSELDSLASVLRQLHSGSIIVVDLRSETHGLLNGNHVSRYGKYNWENIGLDSQTIITAEADLLHSCKGKQLIVSELSSSNNYVPVNPRTLDVSSAQTEEEACMKRGLGYVRFTALDHCFAHPANIDAFLMYARNLPEDTWLHFHCQAGKGRTTMFIVFYDFLRNPDVSAKDIIYRHYLLGGNFVLYQGDDPDELPWKVELYKEKAAMVPLVYKYIQDNHAQGYPLTWTQWKQQFNTTGNDK